MGTKNRAIRVFAGLALFDLCENSPPFHLRNRRHGPRSQIRARARTRTHAGVNPAGVLEEARFFNIQGVMEQLTERLATHTIRQVRLRAPRLASSWFCYLLFYCGWPLSVNLHHMLSPLNSPLPSLFPPFTHSPFILAYVAIVRDGDGEGELAKHPVQVLGVSHSRRRTG